MKTCPPHCEHWRCNQCFPHKTAEYLPREPEGLSWPLQSSDLVRILCQCNPHLLRVLELEYREDNGNHDLLRHLGSSFLALKPLKMRRYRCAGVGIADAQVVRALFEW